MNDCQITPLPTEPEIFSRTRQNLFFKISYSQPANQLLQIELFYCENNTQYVMQVTSQSMKDDEQLGKYFETPRELYEEILENFQEMKIQEYGAIEFNVQIGKRKKVEIRLKAQLRQRAHEIEEKTLIDKEMIARMKKESLLSQQKIEQLESQVRALDETVENQRSQMLELRDHMAQLRSLILSQNRENEQFKSKFESLQKQAAQDSLFSENEQNLLDRLERQLSLDKNSQNANLQIPIKSESQPESSIASQSYIDIQSVLNDSDQDTHLKSSEIVKIEKICPVKKHQGNNFFEYLDNGRILRRKSNNTYWQNCILSSMCKPGTVYILTLQITKCSEGCIQIGIITKELFNKFNTRGEEQSIALDLGHCSLWAAGIPRFIDESKGFEQGDYVRMKVDLINSKIEWFKKTAKDRDFYSVGKLNIQQQFKGKILYPSITMRHLEDTVKLIK